MKTDRQVAKTNAVSVAFTGAAVTRELADMMQILPLKGAAAILTMIFDTVEVVVNSSFSWTILMDFRISKEIRMNAGVLRSGRSGCCKTCAHK